MSVKQNYFYSLLNTISGLLFPIVTFPYVARILMADGIGQVNFYLSIINYITMFAGLGITSQLQRKGLHRKDKRKGIYIVSRTFIRDRKK